MTINKFFNLDQSESYAIVTWLAGSLIQSNSDELEEIIRNLFKKEYTNIILNISHVVEIDGFGVSCIRKGTKICTNEMGLFAVVTQNGEIQDRLDLAKIENFTLLNTVKEAVDAIYLNDLDNDFSDTNEEDQELDQDFSDSESDNYY